MDMPNIRHLRAAVEVARANSVSAAAQRVFLSQPAVTQAIAKLEDRFGVPLFERSAAGVHPTAVGARVIDRAERALEQLERGAAEAMRLSGRTARGGLDRIDHLATASQLRALVALSEAHSFSMAARNIGLSQPSVHRAARDLERMAGVPLFRAGGHSVTLTPAAEALARRVLLAQAELQQAMDEIDASRGADTALITVGSMPLARTRILPHAIHTLLQHSPKVQVRTIEGPYPELLRRLREGRCDFLLGALRDPVPTEDVLQEPIFDNALSVIVRRGHPLTRHPGPELSDTLQYPWIAPPVTTPSGAFLFRALQIEGLSRTPVRVVSSSLILVRGLLLEGDYVTVLSRLQVEQELASGLFEALPIALPGSSRPIGLTMRADWKPTPTQSRFLDIIRHTATQIVGDAYPKTE